MKKEYEALEIEIKKFATVDIMRPSDNIEFGGEISDEYDL